MENGDHETVDANTASKTGGNAAFCNAAYTAAFNGTQIDMQILERNFTDSVRSEVDNVVATVKNRVRSPILAAIDNLVIPTVELAIRSATASSRPHPESVVNQAHQSNFPGNVLEAPHITDSSGLNSNTEKNSVDQNGGNTTVQAGDFPSIENNLA